MKRRSAGDGEDVVAQVAALVEDRGRDEEQEAGEERPPAAEQARAAQQPRQPDDGDAGDGGGDAAGRVGVAEEPLHERGGVEEERPVHEGVVAVALPGGEQPREVGVEALVVVEGAAAEVPETGQDRRGDDQGPAERLDRERDAPAAAGNRGRDRQRRRGRGACQMAVGREVAGGVGRGGGPVGLRGRRDGVGSVPARPVAVVAGARALVSNHGREYTTRPGGGPG